MNTKGYKAVLASGSPRRKELISELFESFEIIPAKGEEVMKEEKPSQLVMDLSYQKAFEIAEGLSQNAIVIGADTVVAKDDRIYGKPKDKEDAKRMLESLSDSEHSVFTGVTMLLLKNGEQYAETFFEETVVKVGYVSEEEIAEYLTDDEYKDKAGAYAIQGKFGKFITGICGDYNNVVGLPVSRLYYELTEFLEENS